MLAGDIDGRLSAYADDGVLWQSYDGHVMPAATTAEGLRSLLADVIEEQHYEDVRRYRIEGGYVQQHTLPITRQEWHDLSGRRLLSR